jgi:hypothetical protein
MEWHGAASAEVRELGYRYVVLQKDAFYNPDAIDDSDVQRMDRLRTELARTLGQPVYDDGRIDIYAPWGDPPPCDPAELETDPVPTGMTEYLPPLRETDTDRQRVARLIVREEAEVAAETP